MRAPTRVGGDKERRMEAWKEEGGRREKRERMEEMEGRGFKKRGKTCPESTQRLCKSSTLQHRTHKRKKW